MKCPERVARTKKDILRRSNEMRRKKKSVGLVTADEICAIRKILSVHVQKLAKTFGDVDADSFGIVGIDEVLAPIQRIVGRKMRPAMVRWFTKKFADRDHYVAYSEILDWISQGAACVGDDTKEKRRRRFLPNMKAMLEAVNTEGKVSYDALVGAMAPSK